MEIGVKVKTKMSKMEAMIEAKEKQLAFGVEGSTEFFIQGEVHGLKIALDILNR